MKCARGDAIAGAIEAVQRIDALLVNEREINGQSPLQRLTVRRGRSKPLVESVETWRRGERRKNSSKGHVDPAGIGLHQCDELLQRIHRKRWFRKQQEGVTTDSCDRRDVANDFDGEFLTQCHVDHVWRADKNARVAARRCTSDGLRGNVATRAWRVLDDDGLSEPRRQSFADDPGEDVRRPTGASEHRQR